MKLKNYVNIRGCLPTSEGETTYILIYFSGILWWVARCSTRPSVQDSCLCTDQWLGLYYLNNIRVFRWSIQLKFILLERFRHADFTPENITFCWLLLSTFYQQTSTKNVIFMIWYHISPHTFHQFTRALG